MGVKMNLKSTNQTLKDHLKSDSQILSDSGEFLKFAAIASSGEPLSLLMGLGSIAKTASTAINTATRLIEWVHKEPKKDIKKQIQNYEIFKILFCVVCQRCYIESIPNAITRIKANDASIQKPIKIVEKKEPDEKENLKLDNLEKKLKAQIANLEECEISFLFGIKPIENNVSHFFEAFNNWFIIVLAYYGYGGYKIKEIVEKCGKDAIRRFNIYISNTTDPTAEWIRNYLVITNNQDTIEIKSDLESIRRILDNWVSEQTVPQQRQKDAWEQYFKTLRELPDQKETMFNEQFGVRKVFLLPQATYHISSAPGEAGKPKIIQNLDEILGALLSNRASSEDLIILCGGPGSGKSTLCRILASELANKENIHPIFLRLRRLKEGSDIATFIEEYLNKQGIIDRLSDLREFPNLIIILDGFDELVMASRSKLRHFFNMLREEHSVGPLKFSKIIVSGRDTLFPQGDGLPSGSHIITLQPFDTSRVTEWGCKWRALHSSEPGHSFHPENLLDTSNITKHKQPLHHLVTWPLTLHLVARIYTAGRLNLSNKKSSEIEKAYLYRTILAETAKRQTDQADTKGRLDPKNMREFLRTLAWAMYSKTTDSMDLSDVMPILGNFYPGYSDSDIAELTDVAVVNAPQLRRGEETGFEFVHKSFAEYLVAEKMAESIEHIIFKTNQYGSEELSWKISHFDAALKLAPVIGTRLITEEVQEMLEPMLGCLSPFLKGERVNEIVKYDDKKDGLFRTIGRFQELLNDFLQGKHIDIIYRETLNKCSVHNPFEIYANYCAGLLILGTAAARQINTYNLSDEKVFFKGEHFSGSFWRCVCTLHAGGLILDDRLSERIFNGLTVRENKRIIDDTSNPIRIGYFKKIDGYNSLIENSVNELIDFLNNSSKRVDLLFGLIPSFFIKDRKIDNLSIEDRKLYLYKILETEISHKKLSIFKTLNLCGLISKDLTDNSLLRNRNYQLIKSLINHNINKDKSYINIKSIYKKTDNFIIDTDEDYKIANFYKSLESIIMDDNHKENKPIKK